MDNANSEWLLELAEEASERHEQFKGFICETQDLPELAEWARNWRKKHLERVYYTCKVAGMHQEPKVKISGSHVELAQRTTCQFKGGTPVIYENMPCEVMKVKKEGGGQCYHALNCVAPCYPKEVTKSIVPTERLSIRTDKRSLDDYLFPLSEMHNPSHKIEKLVEGHCQAKSTPSEKSIIKDWSKLRDWELNELASRGYEKAIEEKRRRKAQMHASKLPVCSRSKVAKLEHCILSVKERNAESGCRKPEGTGSKNCPSAFAVCQTLVGCRFGSGKTVWERATSEQRRRWESQDRQDAAERAARNLGKKGTHAAGVH